MCVLLLKNAEAVVSVLLMRTDDMRLNFVQVEYVLLYCTHCDMVFRNSAAERKVMVSISHPATTGSFKLQLPEASNCN